MGSANLVPVSVASQSLGLDTRRLRNEVTRCFQSGLIVEPLMSLFDLGFVPVEVVRAITREVTLENGCASASP